MSEIVRKQVLVSGRVQGVGYRYFVVEAARLMGVNGWVKNLMDGRVEAELEGTPEIVDALIDRLREGPSSGHVDHAAVTDLPSDAPRYRDFRVTF